jgi:hypothetical protein
MMAFLMASWILSLAGISKTSLEPLAPAAMVSNQAQIMINNNMHRLQRIQAIRRFLCFPERTQAISQSASRATRIYAYCLA